HMLFEQQVELTPNGTALIFEDTQLTYAQVNERANQIASWLRKVGVARNVAVGLCLERSAAMIVALIGVAKAGGVYVPLLPDLPLDRILYQIHETGLKVIVSTENLLARLEGYGGRVLCLDRNGAELDTEPAGNQVCATDSDDLMYILY